MRRIVGLAVVLVVLGWAKVSYADPIIYSTDVAASALATAIGDLHSSNSFSSGMLTGIDDVAEVTVSDSSTGGSTASATVFVENGSQRWTPSAGQLTDVAKWNLLRYIPVNMGEAEDDEEETTQSFPSL